MAASSAIMEANVAEAEEPRAESPFQPVVTAEEDAPAEGGTPEAAAEDPKASAPPAGDRAGEAPEILEAPAPSTPPAARPDPVIPRNWSGILASMTEAASELIVTIIREQETAAVVLEDGPLDAAVEIDVMLDEAVIGEMADIPVRQPDERAGPAARPAATGLPVNVAPAAAGVRFESETPAARQPMPAPGPGEAPQALQLPRMADGVAYVPLPYQFAKDASPAGKAEQARRPYDEDGGEEERRQASAGEEDAGARSGSQENDGDAAPRRNAGDDEPASASDVPVADPLYALYQRMAGWE
jgi:hypothetical protein